MPKAEPRLYLVTPALADTAAFVPMLQDALAQGGVASLLLRLEAVNEAQAKRIIGEIAPLAQDRGVAVVIDGAPQLVAQTGLDGAQVCGAGKELTAAIKMLSPDYIVGAGGLQTRHDAMVAGEAGADYLLFGDDSDASPAAFAALQERVGWWSQLFTTPCVALARGCAEIAVLTRAGADFLMLGDYVWSSAAGAAPAVAEAQRIIAEC